MAHYIANIQAYTEKFLKSWAVLNSTVTPEHLFQLRANHFKVVNVSLSLGPYESYLFFVRGDASGEYARAGLLSLKSNSTDITVSDDLYSLKQPGSTRFSFWFHQGIRQNPCFLVCKLVLFYFCVNAKYLAQSSGQTFGDIQYINNRKQKK